QALCRRGCKMFAQSLGLAGECSIVQTFPDQSPLCCLLRGQWLGQQCKTACPCRADEPWKEPCATRIRHKSDTGKGLNETGRTRGKNDIASECDIAARAGGHTVHRGNNRKGQCAQLADEGIVVRLQCAAEHDRFPWSGEPVAKILTRAEAAACAGNQQRAAALVGLRFVDGLAQRLMHRFVEGIELVGPVERDDAISAADVNDNRCPGCHDFSRNRSSLPISSFLSSKSSAIRW